MIERLPLSALMSQALVAFTIEFDNEAEQGIQHWTTRYGGSSEMRGTWLASMAMWLNCMRYVGPKDLTVQELARRARTETNLGGMVRWGYISVAPDPNDPRAKPPERDWLVRAKPGGLSAQSIWEPLMGEIETRWRERYGAVQIGALQEALVALVSRLDPTLPDCIPVLGYGLGLQMLQVRPAGPPAAELGPAMLLARAETAFGLEYEAGADVSITIGANVLRLCADAVRIADLPRLSGVSKEAIAMATGWLVRHGFAEEGKDAQGKRVLILNAKGHQAREAYGVRTAEIEQRWLSAYGTEAVAGVRKGLERLIREDGPGSRLFEGLTPPPTCWRAKAPKPQILPHFPMVLHRGGYPDGS